MQAVILIYPGAEELDVFAPYEVLRVAGNLGASIETSLASKSDMEPVVLSKGSTVLPQRLYADGPIPDLLVIPGGGWARRAAAGMRAVVEDPVMLEIVRTAHAAGAILASVCTGAMLLSRAGLLAGRPATTHHAAIEDLRSEGAVGSRADRGHRLDHHLRRRHVRPRSGPGPRRAICRCGDRRADRAVSRVRPPWHGLAPGTGVTMRHSAEMAGEISQRT